MKQMKLPGLLPKKRGRKRLHSPGVAHSTRETVASRHPLHINFKLHLKKGTLRNKLVLKFLERAIAKARQQKLGVVHFSLQHNHVHLLIEAKDNRTLTRGMRALMISLVMRLNFYWKKNGQRVKERYHLHVLKTLREVRHAYRYVRNNNLKHTGDLRRGLHGEDVYSSFAATFVALLGGTLDPPRSWLLQRAG